MSKQATTVSEAGFTMANRIRDYDITIDATGESAPDTLEVLVADYASCYIPALRVGAEQRGVDDLGRVEIDVTGELNDDDKLESVAFDVSVEADIGDRGEAIVERAEQLCKVHDALKTSLHADVSIEGGA